MQGGVIAPDRKLGAEVRRLTLKKIKAILESDKDPDFQKAVILKLASTVLPRINEHDGGLDEKGKVVPILVKFIDGSEQNNRDSS
jgi:hypothetical protein